MYKQFPIVCPICKDQLKLEDEKFMMAFEIPYLNIFVHRQCFKSYENIEIYLNNLLEYLKMYKK